MSGIATISADAVVVGGGPVGCVAALAFADAGARVLVLEANERAATRLAGEWLHPAAMQVLAGLGVALGADGDYPSGAGFVVYPEDGSSPVTLPYEKGVHGASLRHDRLVAALRRAVRERGIDYRDRVRVTEVGPGWIKAEPRQGTPFGAVAPRVVIATGRSSVVSSFQAASTTKVVSHMAGVVLEGVTLPNEGYGHVFLGAPGPVLAYRIGETSVRLCLDVPLSFGGGPDRLARLYEAYAPILPQALQRALHRALCRGRIEWATNQVRPRRDFGEPCLAMVGDAVGRHHPLTATGLSLGLHDALSFAKAASFDSHRAERAAAGAVPELLSIALYDVFSGKSGAAREVRRAIIASWRSSAAERRRTMRLLSCEETRMPAFGSSLFRVLGLAGAGILGKAARTRDVAGAARAAQELIQSARSWASAKHMPTLSPVRRPPPAESPHAPRLPARALELATEALLALQNPDGSWEGECVWCPLIAAEYVLAFHLMGRELPQRRRERVLLHFRRTRLPGGLWGLSEVSEPSLFVTTLVYVAARVLGLSASDTLLEPARRFFASEAVESIPTWGKVWLSMLSLYSWDGVNPIAPELWKLPAWLPVHPARYYSHTRLIYIAMATLYAERLTAEVTPLTLALRAELYPGGFDRVNFRRARGALRPGDLWKPPGFALRRGYDLLRLVDACRSRSARAPLLAELRESMRWDLRTTSHTAISPVSGLLAMLALHHADPNDADVARATERFECWIWEDDREGTRVAGARSAIWDTSFAIQALARTELPTKTAAALEAGARYLAAQQIRNTFPGYAAHHRSDPCGGYPFSCAWHGWPVSDCTAEALLSRLDVPKSAPDDHDVSIAAAFILRMQGADGGFGSYEPKRVPFSIEWLNPAEMFGDSMAEAGYVECTASCLAALAAVARERPGLLHRKELAAIPAAIARGERAIRRRQLRSGAWDGAWGVRFLYGTWFGVRGLRAAGVGPRDPAIVRACEWVRSVQRPDGGWGEQNVPHSSEYVQHADGQVVQTAWAMLTLLEGEEPDFAVLERGARFLVSAQLGNGEWPREDPPGLFFRTALLDYALYRSYFPLLSLAWFEERRKAREQLVSFPEIASEELAS